MLSLPIRLNYCEEPSDSGNCVGFGEAGLVFFVDVKENLAELVKTFKGKIVPLRGIFKIVICLRINLQI